MNPASRQGKAAAPTLGIVGVGLIGASLALAARRAGAAGQVLGADRSAASLDKALALGVIDERAALHEIAKADLIVVCVPVAKMGAVFQALAPHLGPSTIVSDTGSTKVDVVAAAKTAFGERVGQFVPAHPIAGREQHGVEAALPDLFVNRHLLLCPLQENPGAAVTAVRMLWESAGAHCHAMSAVQHDAVLAAVSHLPHLLSYALVAQVVNAEDALVKLDFAGAGFRDFTRIAASDPEMWRDIFLANRGALLHELDIYQAILMQLRGMIEKGDGEGLRKVFDKASQTRSAWGTPAWGNPASGEAPKSVPAWPQ
ncbi:MAG: prephenate dehydrogenase/arogenate dehydrogenase family protein [Candidatus Protistobacter heckmanni]|nr:prephenate dehydrogenase/arogenate dehydrogenase family protein [Candidatus Protistobacter heckmanni]